MIIFRHGYRWTQLGKNRWEVAWPSPRWTNRRIYEQPTQLIARIAREREQEETST